eukprot:15466583-Alexandrium_andersonii.AAC.1
MAANSSARRGSASVVVLVSAHRIARFRHRVSWRPPAAAPPPNGPTILRTTILLSPRDARSRAACLPAKTKSPP